MIDVRLYYGSAGLCRYFGAAVFIVARLYQINEKAQVLLICNSRKVAKTELYNEMLREGRREEGKVRGEEEKGKVRES